MTASELIDKLEKLKAYYGDLPVVVGYSSGQDTEVEEDGIRMILSPDLIDTSIIDICTIPDQRFWIQINPDDFEIY